MIPERHTEFSPMIFDVLFGLLVFLGVEGLYLLRGSSAIAFSVASIAIVLHWWLKYKAADETYGLEVANSAMDLLFGVIEIILLQSALLAASGGDLLAAVFYFSLPLLTEAVWALIWRCCGRWSRTSRERVKFMEQQLEATIFLNLGTAGAIGALIVNAALLRTSAFIGIFAALYALYVACTIRWELVDLKLL